MLDNPEFSVRFLVVAQADLKRFIDGTQVGVDLVVHALALAYKVECVAGIDAHGLVFGCVVDLVLAGELEPAVIVAFVETKMTFGQRDAESIQL